MQNEKQKKKEWNKMGSSPISIERQTDIRIAMAASYLKSFARNIIGYKNYSNYT